MATSPSKQSEPIAGYRLIERLGSGAFGEVWKAEAPGGLFKAVKLVHGSLNEGVGKSGSDQELKALNRMKEIRHPFILGVERIDIVENRLVIVTELADGNLWDRFQEHRAKGLPGIPREELLRYMEEAAEAIDMMNIDFSLQHLDIKPQNLFLTHNHVKVGDFGMVKDLEGMTTTMTGTFTPAYGGPETFDGKLTKSSDQYSLAIVYQELLTGKRPFNGTNSRQLMMQHCAMAPDLAPLPEADRPAVGRALAKEHQERFPSCSEFVRALRDGYRGQASPPAAVAAAKPQPVAPAARPALAPPAPQAKPARGAGDTMQDSREETPVKRPAHRPADGAKEKVLSPSAKRAPEAAPKERSEGPALRRKPAEKGRDKTVPSKGAEGGAKRRLADEKPRCPRCGREAVVSAAAIWCLECQYHGTVESDSPASAGSGHQVRGLGDFCRLVWTAPAWAWVLLAGIVAALALSIVPYKLFDESSRMRLYWAEVQFIVGLLAFFVGHMWVVMLLVKDHSHVGLFSPQLWRLAAERLPATRWQVNLGSWGMTGALGGLILGTGYWWAHPTVFDKSADSGLVAAARVEEKQTQDARTGPNPQGTGERISEPVDSRPTEQCAIIGYQVSGDKKRVTLILGILRGTKIVPAGEVQQDLTAERAKGLLGAFRGLERPQPPSWWTGASSSSTVWLKPGELFCEVHRSRVLDSGGLVDPAFKSLLKR
jgi:serine/threonine protein kinase